MKEYEEYYRRFQSGDREAFAAIVDAYRDNLIFFINRYTSSPSLSEEIAEDTFLELLIHPKRYNFSVSLKTYLFTIGRNKAVNFMKRNARTDELCDASMRRGCDDPDFRALEREYIKNERAAAVDRAMKKLSQDYRTVLHLMYFEEMSCSDAGRIMHKTKKQAYNLSSRAREALKKALAEEGFTDEE